MRLLDLFCKAGGASRGYQMAGFHVTGVDIEDQPRYIGDDFYKGDALEFLAKYGHEFDAIAASPPCQAYSEAVPVSHRLKHPDLIAATRIGLVMADKPYVIENVEGARRHLIDPVMLCGTMFGLPVWRHRYFEASFLISTGDCDHSQCPRPMLMTPPGSNSRRSGNNPHPKEVGQAVGCGWMTARELSQAIPPAYTQFIGDQLIQQLRRAA